MLSRSLLTGSTFLALGLFLGQTQACTMSIQLSQNTVNFGGSNVVKCQFYAYTSDSPDLYSDSPDAYAELDCGGGCGTLSLNDQDWEACIDGTGGLALTGTATVKEGDATQTIYPGGQESSHVDDNPLSSGRYEFYWISNVAC